MSHLHIQLGSLPDWLGVVASVASVAGSATAPFKKNVPRS